MQKAIARHVGSLLSLRDAVNLLAKWCSESSQPGFSLLGSVDSLKVLLASHSEDVCIVPLGEQVEVQAGGTEVNEQSKLTPCGLRLCGGLG